MLERTAATLISRVASIGARDGDPPDLRLRKTLLLLLALMVLPAGIVWGALYWGLGEQTAAILPWAYTAFSFLAIVLFARTGSLPTLRRLELLAILVTPFALGVVLGGLVASSAVVLWSLLAPLGAIAFGDPRRAWRWFVAFIAMVALTTPLGAVVRPVPAALPPDVVVWFMALNIVSVSLVAFVVLASFARLRQEAQEQADALLLNILPAEIAEQLKASERLRAGRRVIAEPFEEASVLFADVVDFTPMSSRLAPADVVQTLDHLFGDFDDLVDQYGVEKIKTIGDAYMVAAGVPTPRTDHAEVLARLALDLCATAARHTREDGSAIALRIGLNSGPVVAGVIGRRKFIYDLWGDTVNVASRMESQGMAGRIQVAEPAYRRLGDRFVFEMRGEIEVKGKGTVRTWFLTGEQPTGPEA